MNKLIAFLFIAFTTVSCGTIKEEIWIDADQQIQLEFSMALGKEMTAPFAKAFGSLFGGNFSADTSFHPQITGNFSVMGIPVNNQDIVLDTLIYLKDMPELQYDSILFMVTKSDSAQKMSLSQQQNFSRKLYRLLSSTVVHVQNNSPECFLFVSLKTGKTPMDELTEIGHGIKTIWEDSIYRKPNAYFFTFNKRRFERGSLSLWDKAAYQTNISDDGGMNRFIEALLKQMQIKEWISVIHTPYEIKNTTHPESRLSADRKTVTVSLTPEDIKAGKTFENKITFHK